MAAWKFEKGEPLPLEKVHTPGMKTIEEVAGFLGVKPENTGKAVFYQDAHTGELIFVLIRGDFEVNEVKLANALKVPELKFADDAAIEAAGAVPGFASPVGIDPGRARIVVDRSAAESGNLVVGANEADFHYRNFNFDRDLAGSDCLVTDIACVREGDPCPLTGQPLQFLRGIEVGNIFQLGTKYTRSMHMTYIDSNGEMQYPIMGCYGIGIGRVVAYGGNFHPFAGGQRKITCSSGISRKPNVFGQTGGTVVKFLRKQKTYFTCKGRAKQSIDNSENIASFQTLECHLAKILTARQIRSDVGCHKFAADVPYPRQGRPGVVILVLVGHDLLAERKYGLIT